MAALSAAILMSAAPALAGKGLDTITEAFTPAGADYLPLNVTPAKSTDTGYLWSGYPNTLHGLALANQGTTYDFGVCLDFSGGGRGYDNLNAWTVFNGDFVKGLRSVVFEWSAKSVSDNMEAQAVIQDAGGDWFVSDDVVGDMAATKQVVDARKTSWKRLRSAPEIGKPLVVGEAGKPDLSKVLGGGLQTVGIGVGGQTRLNTLTFTSKKIDIAKEKARMRGKPTQVQLDYHDDEIMMFVHWGPAAWQGVEGNNHSNDIKQMNPSKLDTDQWCEVAKSFGAKRIIQVAKHVGNFLWWSSDIGEYGIKHTGYKDGKGDVVAELRESCEKFGIKQGVYVNPHRTTPEIYRKELSEVLSRYGEMCEVWFDGGMKEDVMDILGKYAPNAIYFSGPVDHMNARWPGSESGFSPEPAWQTVVKRPRFLYTGAHSDPDGDLWMPMEMDTTLLDHWWFWAPNRDATIKSLDHLMVTYYRSVGRGGVLLLNSSPDTTGVIPESHVKRYKEFGDAIKRLYAGIKGETSGKGKTLVLKFDEPREVNHIITMEDIREGHIVRKYEIDGKIDGKWQLLVQGDAIGHKRIDVLDTVKVSQLRFRATEAVDTPLIKSFAAYEAPVYKYSAAGLDKGWKSVVDWKHVFTGKMETHDIDLTPFIKAPGQYEVSIAQHPWVGNLEITSAVMVMAGVEEPRKIEQLQGYNYRITRTAAIVEGSELSTSVLRLEGRFISQADNSVLISIRQVF